MAVTARWQHHHRQLWAHPVFQNYLPLSPAVDRLRLVDSHRITSEKMFGAAQPPFGQGAKPRAGYTATPKSCMYHILGCQGKEGGKETSHL